MSAPVQKISSHTAAPNGANNSLLIVGHAVGIAVTGGASPKPSLSLGPEACQSVIRWW